MPTITHSPKSGLLKQPLTCRSDARLMVVDRQSRIDRASLCPRPSTVALVAGDCSGAQRYAGRGGPLGRKANRSPADAGRVCSLRPMRAVYGRCSAAPAEKFRPASRVQLIDREGRPGPKAHAHHAGERQQLDRTHRTVEDDPYPLLEQDRPHATAALHSRRRNVAGR